mgnify:CR=1 FL=1
MLFRSNVGAVENSSVMRSMAGPKRRKSAGTVASFGHLVADVLVVAVGLHVVHEEQVLHAGQLVGLSPVGAAVFRHRVQREAVGIEQLADVGTDLQHELVEVVALDEKWRALVAWKANYDLHEHGYRVIQSTKPQSLAYGPTKAALINLAETLHNDLAEAGVGDLADLRWHQRPDGSAHKFDIAYKDHPRKGYIGLQDHGQNCWYKNIKLKLLSR